MKKSAMCLTCLVWFSCMTTVLVAGGLIPPSPTYSSEETGQIRKYMPAEFEGNLTGRGLSEDVLNSFVSACYYERDSCHSPTIDFIICYADGSGDQMLVIVRRDRDTWRKIADYRFLGGETGSGINFVDIDCDTVNEIVLGSYAGAAGNMVMNIFKYANDTLVLISPSSGSDAFVGRMIEITGGDQGCARKVIVYRDDRIKYQPDTTRIYRYNFLRAKYELEGVDKYMPKP